MDQIDLEISKALLMNSRTSYSALAEMMGMSVNAVHKRVQAMMEAGIIREFTTKLSLPYLRVVMLNAWGRGEGTMLSSAMEVIGEHACTSWAGMGGGGSIYVTAHLQSIEQMEDYLEFLRSETGLGEMTLGLNTHPVDMDVSQDSLGGLDKRIIRAMRHDSRRSAAQIADDTGISVKTVRRRLDRLIEGKVIEMSVEWYPDLDNDILCMYHIHLGIEAKKHDLYPRLYNLFSGTMLYAIPFSNIPDIILAMFWSNNMKGVREQLQAIESLPEVDWVEPNVLYAGKVFRTWRDELP